MKKEFIIYIGLILTISVLFSFEFMVEIQKKDLPISSFEADQINSISFEMPANVYFISGHENKIILEGNSIVLDQVKLHSKSGQFILKRDNTPSLFSMIYSVISPAPTLNMYVIARDLESINIINQDGCLVNNGVFNEDRGIIEVDDSNIIQLTRSNSIDYSIIHSNYCKETTAQLITSCL